MNCSGCSGCALICPKGCIEMHLNEDGFFHPQKKEDNCTRCGLCEKVCPQLHVAGKSLDDLNLYSAQARNKLILNTSSSGGIAAVLASKAINEGKTVCGVIYDYENHKAKHVITKDLEMIPELQGSKYLQSDNCNAFGAVLEFLKAEATNKAMIFGTPCQIAGLHRVLELKDLRDRAFLVDIFCHGVPSQNLWKKYLTVIIKKLHCTLLDIKSVIFRDKQYSWHKYYMHIRCGVGEYIQSTCKDEFLKLFTMGVVNQQSCFTCPYRNQTVADIRIGDYWGKRYQESEEGYTMLLVNTQKGEEMLHSIETEIAVEKQDIRERFGQQHMDYKIPKHYKTTMDMLRNESVSLKSIINLYETDFDRFRNLCKRIKHLF